MTDEQITALVEQIRRTYTDDLIDALEAENARLREAKWIVRHADTANDTVLMGMARDGAIAERDALAAENAWLRDALGFYANLPCRLEFGVVNECPYDDGDTARAALTQETQP
jgi:hypothetical protein